MVSIGVISKPHGIKGEVRVHPLIDCPDIIKAGTECRLIVNGNERTVEIMQARLHSDVLIVKIKEVNDRNEAESLRGAEFVISEDELPDRDDGSFYAFQLIGLKVVAVDGRNIGVVTDIMETPGQVTYVIDAGGREVLIPAVEEFVKDVNLNTGVIKILPIEGLID